MEGPILKNFLVVLELSGATAVMERWWRERRGMRNKSPMGMNF